MNSSIAQNIILFISLVLLQVIILNNVELFGYINPFLYILFVILYPFKRDRGGILFLAFLLGLIIDIFSNSGGTNAAATLFIAYVRLPILKYILRKSEIDFVVFNITKQPFLKIVSFVSILIFIHSLIVFTLEYFKLSDISIILSRTILTSIFTIILTVFSIILLTRKK